ncbi:MAG: AAA family ATPase [Thermoplasmatota archaeon]
MEDEIKGGPGKGSILELLSERRGEGPRDLGRLALKARVRDLEQITLQRRGIPALKIDSVRLDGFGPHDGPNLLEIRDGLTLITGGNGTGKTHIILAIHWCLFGERGSLDPWMSEIDPMGKDLVNWERKGTDDERMEVEVDLTWDGERFSVLRSYIGGEEHFEVRVTKGERKFRRESLPEGLEPDVLAYLLFQGEAVMFLASEDPFLSEGNLRSLVLKLSGGERSERLVEVISEAREGLFELSRELRKTTGPLETELSSLTTEATKLEERIGRTRGRIEELSVERKEHMRSYKKLLKDLSDRGSLSDSEREEAVSRARLPVIEEQVSNMLDGAGREVLRSLCERALASGLEEREERLRSRMMKGAIESQISIVRNISEKGKCLCGASIGRSGMGRKRISSLLSRLEERSNELSHNLTEPIWTSDQVLEGARRCLSSMGFSRKDYLERIEDLERASGTLMDTVRKGSREKDRLDELVSRVREMERSSTLLEREKGDLRNLMTKLKELRARKRVVERELSRVWGVQGGETGYVERIEALDRTISRLERDSGERMGRMRMGIEKRANEILSRLDPGGRLGELRIHERTYRIGRIIGEGEKERVVPMAYLSAGERELAALSVLSSIPGISGGMLLLDSPFPYIDRERKERILEGLPDISDRVLISLPEGTLSNSEVERSRTIWEERGGRLGHYRLEMTDKGSIIRECGGGEG